MRTTFKKIESEDELPEGTIRNLTRPNLFGCLYTDENLDVKEDLGILGVEGEVILFKKKLDSGIVTLLNTEEIDYVSPMGSHRFIRKADVTLYYISSNFEKRI